MFGLTKREQRWKAEQQAAELLVGLAQVIVRAAADIRIAEANAERPASSTLASGEPTVNPASKASEPGEQTSAVSSPAAAPAVLQTADGVTPSHEAQQEKAT